MGKTMHVQKKKNGLYLKAILTIKHKTLSGQVLLFMCTHIQTPVKERMVDVPKQYIRHPRVQVNRCLL